MCVYSGVDSSSSGGGGGASARRGVRRTEGDTGVCVSGGTQRIDLVTFTVRTRVRTPSFEQTAKRQTDGGFWGLGSPRHAQPLPGRGAPGKERQTRWRLEAPNPETGSEAHLPPTLAPLGRRRRASPGPPRTTQLGHYGFEEMNSQSGQETRVLRVPGPILAPARPVEPGRVMSVRAEGGRWPAQLHDHLRGLRVLVP